MSNLIYLGSEMPNLGIKLLKKALSEAERELSKIKESEKLSFVDIGNKRDLARKEMAFLEGEILGLQDVLEIYSNGKLYKEDKREAENKLVNKKAEFALKEKEFKKFDRNELDLIIDLFRKFNSYIQAQKDQLNDFIDWFEGV